MFAFLKQSTATQTRIVGPFVDDTDFKSLETALTINNTDVKLSKNGGTAANKNSGGGTHIINGNYALTFDATDTNTVGELHVSVSVTGALVVVAKFWVLEEAIYDALFGAAAAGFDANQRVDIGRALGVAWGSGAITAAAIATDAIAAAKLAADAVQKIADKLIPKKNTALSDVEFVMVDNTDHITPKTGLTITVTRSIDGGAFAAKDASTTVAEVGNGVYQLDIAAADLNGTIVTFRFAATGADDAFLTIRTSG